MWDSRKGKIIETVKNKTKQFTNGKLEEESNMGATKIIVVMILFCNSIMDVHTIKIYANP